MMKRFSVHWWAIILPTSIVVGVPAFLIAGFLTDWGVWERALAGLIAMLAADLAIAVSMEVVAPTRLDIGPGEKVLGSDPPAEEATIIGGFGGSSKGQVFVRGETWMATCVPEDSGVLSKGMRVRVVHRDGLNLMVSPKPE
jgi:membrane protein implicated in regulation of membrane protease activity